jgi:hypothetical protein
MRYRLGTPPDVRLPRRDGLPEKCEPVGRPRHDWNVQSALTRANMRPTHAMGLPSQERPTMQKMMPFAEHLITRTIRQLSLSIVDVPAVRPYAKGLHNVALYNGQ